MRFACEFVHLRCVDASLNLRKYNVKHSKPTCAATMVRVKPLQLRGRDGHQMLKCQAPVRQGCAQQRQNLKEFQTEDNILKQAVDISFRSDSSAQHPPNLLGFSIRTTRHESSSGGVQPQHAAHAHSVRGLIKV